SLEDPYHWAFEGPFIVREVTQYWDTADGYRSRMRFFSDSFPGAQEAKASATTSLGAAVSAMMAALSVTESAYYDMINVGISRAQLFIMDTGAAVAVQYNPD